MTDPLLLAQHLHDTTVAPRVIDACTIRIIFVLAKCRLVSKLAPCFVTIPAVLYEMLPLPHLGAFAPCIAAEADWVVTNHLDGYGTFPAIWTSILRCDV